MAPENFGQSVGIARLQRGDHFLVLADGGGPFFGAFMADDGHYVDVPIMEVDEGARGPAETTARLALGIAPLQAYEPHDGPIVASGDMVVTEHRETWTWDDDHTVTLPFTSVMEVRDGKVARWWDYLDLSTLMNAAPAWWVDHIAPGYK